MYSFTKQDLLIVIGQYQAAVAEAVGWLRQKDFSNIVLALDRSGYIDGQEEIRYTFHGCGCLVALNDVSVDFDFGFDGRIDGFNLWFVYDYYQQSSLAENRRVSFSEMEGVAEELIDEKSITQLAVELEDGTQYSDGLYYLAKDCQNPNPPTFKLRCKQMEDLLDNESRSA
jgi:hypothetical protein